MFSKLKTDPNDPTKTLKVEVEEKDPKDPKKKIKIKKAAKASVIVYMTVRGGFNNQEKPPTSMRVSDFPLLGPVLLTPYVL